MELTGDFTKDLDTEIKAWEKYLIKAQNEANAAFYEHALLHLEFLINEEKKIK